MGNSKDNGDAENIGIGATYKDHSTDKQSQVELASGLDQAVTRAVLVADDMGLDPAVCVGIGIQNLAEYGCWRSDGSAPLVAITALHALTRRFESYVPDDHERCSVEILMDWTTEPNGNVPVYDLLQAVAEFITTALEFENGIYHSNQTSNRH